MQYAKAKEQANQDSAKVQATLAKARAALVERLKDTKAFRDLVKELQAFENNPDKEGFLTFDESGALNSEMQVTLDDCLCCDESGEEDSELAEAVLQAANPDLTCWKERGTRGASHWIANICYGEPCIVNVPPQRNHYAVYSEELGLKLNSGDVKSEEHALMLVEQAMRKAGVFGDVVSTDYNGCPSRLEISKEVREATDEQLQAMIDNIENSDAEE